MPHFAAGVVRFQTEVFPEKQELFESLAKGQSPEALFITCSDSRIETAMITQTDPGELFICRNAGNIVPPHTNHTGGMTASIEFAVAALKVPHIVICGHTECGAMKGAMNPEGLDSLPHVREWLGYSRAAVEVVKHLGSNLDDTAKMQMLLEQNVILQLNHLKTHPSVAARLAAGDLQLHGWVYDIRTGDVTAYDEATGKFAPVHEHYASEMAALALEKHQCAA
ncbi:carbonic anhydrase [Sphingomonas ursincola]|jgi:carbonic anhydrase|uniref:Carbonic anhydrase n=1 Tax=Sphingomonas ursincola TaxID=56361 RepID=A0A7V8REA4_9SPHN|nr:carbonic anhydrase [Sphingomonas ursincola]MBA1374875.1 carbonic anhydrase [Sphingomonas ursincola]MBY0619262.1 carbonic anhydrase [Sphingomonas ursincola]